MVDEEDIPKICLDLHNFKWSIKSKLAAGARAAVGELDLRDIKQPSEWVFMELEKKCRNVLKKKRNTETVETSGEHLFQIYRRLIDRPYIALARQD